jgi:hypothetical protein
LLTKQRLAAIHPRGEWLFLLAVPPHSPKRSLFGAELAPNAPRGPESRDWRDNPAGRRGRTTHQIAVSCPENMTHINDNSARRHYSCTKFEIADAIPAEMAPWKRAT